MVKVAILGAAGKMGLEIVRAVFREKDFLLTAAIDIGQQGQDIGLLAGLGPLGVPVAGLEILQTMEKPDVLIDFTNAESFRKTMPLILEKGISVVSGSTGLSEEEMAAFGKLAAENGATLFIAPNFAIGAVLMMQFAKEAARYIDNVEIIEYHHDQKLDAPSGTAKKTLEDISQVRKEKMQGNPKEFETIPASRGGQYQGMRVHSIRVPGYVASQEVIFGTLGQTLTIRHDSISRESFMPGIVLACKKINSLENGLVYGLEKIM